MSLSLFEQPSGRAAVVDTLRRMARLANGAILDPLIRDQAALAIAAVPKGNRPAQCAALLAWVNRRLRYVPDPAGVETLHDPRLYAQAIYNRRDAYGDCDDMSTYLAALMKAVGLRPTFRAVGYNGRPLSHVYVVCEGMKLDATRDAWTSAPAYIRETDSIEQGV